MNRTPIPAHLRPGMISPPQEDLIRDLIRERDLSAGLTPAQIEWLQKGEYGGLTKGKASEIITLLLKLPHTKKQTSKLPDVQAGRYAVPNEDGKLAFYVVSRPTEGRWAGYTFVDVMASDEKWPIRDFAAKRTILQKIANDPDAGPRFGREIGRCYVCGRTLTDELSRELGIGPVCRAA